MRIADLEVIERPSIDSFEPPQRESQLLDHADGGPVADLDAGHDAAQMEIAEPEVDEGACGLGGQATSPVGRSQSESERALSRNRAGLPEMGIDATVPDVAAARLENGGPEA